MGVFSDGGRHLQQRRGNQSLSKQFDSASKPNSRRKRWGNRQCDKFVRLIRSIEPRKLHTANRWGSVPIHSELFWTWNDKSNSHTKSDHHRKCHRHNKYVYSISTLVLSLLNPTISFAQGVGGVSATANPIANSSGSVTNQAIQVLQGPYITNTYGNNISCQGATANFTPYVQYSDSRKDPWEDFYDEPQYNMTDLSGKTTKQTVSVKNYPWEEWYDTRTYVNDDGETVRWFPDGSTMEIEIDVDGPDGVPDAVSSGSMSPTWYKPIRTDMRANQSFNIGLSATLSMPLDRKLSKLCKQAAETQIAQQQQITANKRLDFEIARLKNCGELKQKGIMFAKSSAYYSICEDVIVTKPAPGTLPDHTHQLGKTTSSETSSSQNSSEGDPSSLDKDSSSSQKQMDGKGFFRGLSLPWRRPSSPEVSQPSGADLLGVWQVGQMKSPQEQSPQ